MFFFFSSWGGEESNRLWLTLSDLLTSHECAALTFRGTSPPIHAHMPTHRMPRISVKLVFFFSHSPSLDGRARSRDALFQTRVARLQPSSLRASNASDAVIKNDSRGHPGRGEGRALWSLWSPCCGLPTFGWQTSVLCARLLWCGTALMSKHTSDGVGMRVVPRALPDTWGNREAEFTREFEVYIYIYITQRSTDQIFPPPPPLSN